MYFIEFVAVGLAVVSGLFCFLDFVAVGSLSVDLFLPWVTLVGFSCVFSINLLGQGGGGS